MIRDHGHFAPWARKMIEEEMAKARKANEKRLEALRPFAAQSRKNRKAETRQDARTATISRKADRGGESEIIRLTLPWPPSVNHYWRHGTRGRVYLSAEADRFRQLVWLECVRQHVKLLAGPVYLSIEVRPPDKRRRDLDNLLKALLDALQYGRCFGDDYQISDLRIRRGPVMAGGQVLVTMTPDGEELLAATRGRKGTT